MTKGIKTMRVEKLHALLLATSLLAAGCASQPTQMQKAAAEAAAKKAGTYKKEDTGPFRKVVRDGKTFYCDNGPTLGSKLAKAYCMNEDQYAQWKETNATIKQDIDRNSRAISTNNGDPGRPRL